jgi:hypothetical protein
MLCERYLTMSFRPSKAQPAGQMLSPPMSAPKGPLHACVSSQWKSTFIMTQTTTSTARRSLPVRLVNATGSQVTLEMPYPVVFEYGESGLCSSLSPTWSDAQPALLSVPLAKADIEIALKYRSTCLLRSGWDGEPLDLTPKGLDRAKAYFHGGEVGRRLKFLGLG